jgi:hypothetical protein
MVEHLPVYHERRGGKFFQRTISPDGKSGRNGFRRSVVFASLTRDLIGALLCPCQQSYSNQGLIDQMQLPLGRCLAA